MENDSTQQGKHAQHASPIGGKPSSHYVAALDGLRAFAVLAVIFYHMGLGWAPGGLMGVTVFFVISGYLINGLLVAECDAVGTISLKGFWMRRVRRLFPAILLAVVGTAALCTLFDHVLLDKMRPDIVPSLLFYNNWWQIFRDVSYFEAAGDPSPLTHFWSLSIEEQFYVVWPLVLLAMYKMRIPKGAMSTIVVVLAVASAAEMALLYDPYLDPSRVYYGTDTRAFSLLLGVWLAFAWPSAIFGRQPAVDKRDKLSWVLLNGVGVLALAGLVAVVVLTNGFSAFPYVGGTALVSVLSALLIVVLVVPETWVARLFALRPLVWIGKRSYGMYLWHFPILLLMTDVNSTVEVPWWMRLVQLAVIFGVSALSYTFVEDPIRRGKLGEWWRARRAGTSRESGLEGEREKDGSGEKSPVTRGSHERDGRSTNTSAGKLGARGVVPACFSAVLLAVAVAGLAGVQPPDYAEMYAGLVQGSATQRDAQVADDAAQASDESAGTDGEGAASGGASGGDEAASGEAAADGDEAAGSSAASSESDGSPSSASAGSAANSFEVIFGEQHLNAAGTPVFEPLLIGDSVSLGAEAEFYRVFPFGHLDSVVSRNIWESPYADYRDAGQVGDYVVFCLGTNNAVEDWQIDNDLLAAVSKDKKVFMVNTRNTCDWMDATNASIARTPQRHSNVTVLDWFGASTGHDEYFAGDGTHLTEEGARAYIELIRSAIAKSLES